MTVVPYRGALSKGGGGTAGSQPLLISKFKKHRFCDMIQNILHDSLFQPRSATDIG